MTHWIGWFVLAGALVILEMFTGTFYLLMIAIGMAAGGLAALAGFSGATQLLVGAAVGTAATIALHRSRFGKPNRTQASRDVNVNLDIGETIMVSEWPQGATAPAARAMYRGAMWDIELDHGAVARPGAFIIREVQGNRLIVANKDPAQ